MTNPHTEQAILNLPTIRSRKFNEPQKCLNMDGGSGKLYHYLRKLKDAKKIHVTGSSQSFTYHLGPDPNPELTESQNDSFTRDYAKREVEVAPGCRVVTFGNAWPSGKGQSGRVDRLGVQSSLPMLAVA